MLTSVLPSQMAHAQLIPDATLNAQSSIVQTTGPVDLIQGGYRVGRNLFHSFQEFNVGTGRSLYFTDPGVTNILARVTGRNASQINGKLGVEGTANLYLLNPYGIVFGADASLDVRGSFTATTANAIQFADGSEFSATNPTAPNLLTIAVPVGLQRGGPLAPITNRGQLTVGQDLTLDAATLDLQGQLQAGRHLNLFATDTVTIRDTVAQPFLARAGGAITIRGDRGIDILALNHLNQTPFVSGGTLMLQSDGVISGDAHFASKGFSLLTLDGRPGEFVSLYDPIIQANGDVVFGNYTGVALKVEATGSIQGGNIRITGPDGAIPGNDPDAAILTGGRALILRAGVPSIASPNLPQAAGATNFVASAAAPGAPPGSILVGNIDTFDATGGNGGFIQLTATGTITTNNLQSYSAATVGNAGNGGAILVTAGGDITIRGLLNASAQSAGGNSGPGGAITLSSAVGAITTQGSISSRSVAQSVSGNGGRINLVAAGPILVEGNILANSVSSPFPGPGSAGNGGGIALSSIAGDITTNGTLSSFAISDGGSTTGSGGAIALSTTVGNITTNAPLQTYTRAGQNPGNGGAITLSTTTGHITTNADLRADSTSLSFPSPGRASNGGAIALSTTTGNITTNRSLVTTSFGPDGAADGGSISLQSVAGNLTTNSNLVTVSGTFSGTAANSGHITLATAVGNITATGSLDTLSYADQGNAGNGGSIVLSAPNGQVTGGAAARLNSISISETGQSGNGGNVTIAAKNQITQFEILTLASSENSGAVQVNGFDDLTLTNTQILTSKQVEIQLCGGCGNVSVLVGGKGKSGNVTVNSVGDLTLTNSRIESDTKGRDTAGNIAIASGGWLTFNNSQVSSNTSSTGQAGNITVAATGGVIVGRASTLSAQTRDRGNAGNITINTPDLTLRQGAKVATTAIGSGQAGTIAIQTNRTTITGNSSGIISGSGTPAERGGNRGNGGNVRIITDSLTLNDNGIISTSTFARGHSGSIDIMARAVELTTGGKLSATSQDQGNAGNITVNASDRVLIAGSQSGFLAVTTPGAVGHGGSISVATGVLEISNGGHISAASRGRGQGGDVTVTAQQMTLRNQGEVVTDTASSDGGNITLNVRDILLLRHNSLISASAGTAQQGGNGGNVTINASFVVGVLSENSDIRANAFTGNGGRVNITAQGIYGLKYQTQDTPFSDITASSALGTSGTVTLNTLNVDPNRGLVQLPDDFSDSSDQIVQTCSPRQQSNSFIVTGRGGVAPSASEVLNQVNMWRDAGPVEGREQMAAGTVVNPLFSTSNSSAALVEATTWHRTADGAIVLVAEGSEPTSAVSTVACQTPMTVENK